jgi:hypothetical protein
VGERWYDPPPPLNSAVASAPSHSDIRACCCNSVLAAATGSPSPSQQPPITGPNLWDPCTWPSSSSSVWLTWPQPLGPQHPSQHSCISSSAPLRDARAAPPQEGSRYTLGPIGRPSLCCCHLLRLLSLSTLSPPPMSHKKSTLRPKKLSLPVCCRRYPLIVFSVCAAGGSLALLGTIRLFCDAKIIQRAELVSKLRLSC